MRPGVRKLIVLALVVSLASLPGAASAKEKQGAALVIATKNGSSVGGELIAVKQSSLVLLSPAGKDELVAVGEISTVTIVGKSKAGKGFLTGLIIGGITGGVIGAVADTDHEYTAMIIAGGALLIGAVGGLIGLGIGAAAGGDETIGFGGLTEDGKSQVLQRLRGMARLPGAQ